MSRHEPRHLPGHKPSTEIKFNAAPRTGYRPYREPEFQTWIDANCEGSAMFQIWEIYDGSESYTTLAGWFKEPADAVLFKLHFA